jgi:hypothetical protein
MITEANKSGDIFPSAEVPLKKKTKLGALE